MKTRILYDHQAFTMQKYGGVSRCFVELFKNLPNGLEASIALYKSDNVYVKDLMKVYSQETVIDRLLNNHYFKGAWRLQLLLKQYREYRVDKNEKYSIERLKKGEYDIFHPTFFNDYFLPYLNGKPFVLTIHDMTPELYPQYYKANDFQIVMKRKLAPLANAVIAVSENTKKDIIRILGIPEEKIHVIYHGCSLSIPKEAYKPFHFPYILYVGDRRGYKNFIPFVKQVSPFLKQNNGLHVVCTGHSFNKEEKQLFNECGVSNLFINTWAKTDTDLYNLYHYARCFVYPSEYEGFGIPILEAYKADCPVLLNRASCFPEIARDAAVYFNIDSSKNDLYDKLELIFSMSVDERASLITKQHTRLADFSWGKSAEQLSQIYKSI